MTAVRVGNDGSTVLAAAGGFFVGAVVTTLAWITYYYYKNNSSLDGGTAHCKLAQSRSAYASSHARSSSSASDETFLTDLLKALWPHVNAAAATEIARCAAPNFEALPVPLRGLRFTKLSLGRVPVRLDNVIVHDCARNSCGRDYVQFDADVVWDGDCDIQLSASFGSFGVRSIKLSGRVSVVLQPLSDEIPIVGAVQYAFINTPHLELDFTGLAQLADVSSLKASIVSTMLTTIEDMMVLPVRSIVKMDPATSILEIHQPPLGVARLTLRRGRGFRIEKRALRTADIPDVYCTMQVGGSAKVWKTAIVENSVDPVWNHNETADFVLYDHDQMVHLHALDRDVGNLDADDSLGVAKVTFGELLLAGGTDTEVALHDAQGRTTGAFVTLHCDLLPFIPDLACFSARPKRDDGATGETIRGLLTILVAQALELPVAEETESDEPPAPDSYVAIAIGTTEFVAVATTGGANPSYDGEFRVPITPAMLAGRGADKLPPVVLSVHQGTPDASRRCYGTVEVSYETIAHASGCSVSGRQKIGDLEASLNVGVSLCGIRTPSEGVSSRKAISEPNSKAPSKSLSDIGSAGSQVRITAVKGRGFEIEKKLWKKDDIPDVYCKIKFGSSPMAWRTSTIRNSVAPEWNESHTFRTVNRSEILLINAFDEDAGRLDVDDEIGYARISVRKLLLAGGICDCELLADGNPTGSYITIRCEVLASPTSSSNTAIKPTPSSLSSSASDVVPDSEEDAASTVAVSDDTVPEVPATQKNVRVRLVKGSGFAVEKRFMKKNRIPDVYCEIQMGDAVWKTSTERSSVNPAWTNEIGVFPPPDEMTVLRVEVFDEDSGSTDRDALLGYVVVPVRELLAAADGGDDTMLQLQRLDGEATGSHIILHCEWTGDPPTVQ